MRTFLTLFFAGLCVASIVWFVIGIISPQKAIKWGKKEPRNRKAVVKYGVVALIVSFLLTLIAAPPLTPEQKLAMEQKRQEREQKELNDKESAIQKIEEDSKTSGITESTADVTDKKTKQQKAEEKALQEQYDQQAKYEEWLKWKDATEHPYMKILTDSTHPKVHDNLKDVEKFYKKNDVEEYVVISKGVMNTSKKSPDWLFWYNSMYDRKAKIDRITDITCAFSRIHGGMTLGEALPIILTYLPTGEVNNHRRTAYRASKSGNELPFYLFQFSDQLYLSVKIDDGCVSSFTIGGEPYTGKGYNDSYGYESMEYDLKPFVKE